jgi:hypothetical protein
MTPQSPGLKDSAASSFSWAPVGPLRRRPGRGQVRHWGGALLLADGAQAVSYHA